VELQTEGNQMTINFRIFLIVLAVVLIVSAPLLSFI
jgi:hypothetical protein